MGLSVTIRPWRYQLFLGLLTLAGIAVSLGAMGRQAWPLAKSPGGWWAIAFLLCLYAPTCRLRVTVSGASMTVCGYFMNHKLALGDIRRIEAQEYSGAWTRGSSTSLLRMLAVETKDGKRHVYPSYLATPASMRNDVLRLRRLTSLGD